jgi:hypothetical protein
LLAGLDGKAWKAAAERLADDLRLGLKALAVGDGAIQDPDGQWAAGYGIDDAGAVLVRPDAYVAWRNRSMTVDPVTTLRTALNQILCKAPPDGRMSLLRPSASSG